MVPSPLLCSRFPSYDVVLKCRVACSASTGPEAAGAHALNRKYARAHTHLQEVRLLNFIAGNATALQKDLNGTKRDLDIGWLILCGALVFFMQVLCECAYVRYLDAFRVCTHTTLRGVYVHMGYATFTFSGGICDVGSGHRAKQKHGKYSVQKCD
jgi:hypothetical protein